MYPMAQIVGLTPAPGGSGVTHPATAFPVFDPFFINNNKVAGVSIVSDQLLGRSNFVNWKKSTKIALSARSKLSLIRGKVPKSSDPTILEQ